MSAEQHTAHHGDHATMTKRKIWNVFWVLFAITTLEFILALAVPTTTMPQDIKNVIYIVLTLLKAFYIVAFFMHLKFEMLGLIYIIIVPMVFIIGFIAAMLFEGNFWMNIRM
jgi:cytochrome c oxidase subunit IV